MKYQKYHRLTHYYIPSYPFIIHWHNRRLQMDFFLKVKILIAVIHIFLSEVIF